MTTNSSLVLIRDLEFQGKHGASADERRSHRRFQVDLTIEADLRRAVGSDRLADTVDYHKVCALVVEIGSARTYHLLEALAGAMIEAIHERWPKVVVEIELRKLHPPCPGNPAYTAVRLRRG